MTAHEFEDPDVAYMAALRREQRAAMGFQLAAAVAAGEHIHLLDGDGDWCLGDCDIPLRTGVRGVQASKIILDECQEWPPQ